MEQVEHFTYLISVVETHGGKKQTLKPGWARQAWFYFNSRTVGLFCENQNQDFQYEFQGCSSLHTTTNRIHNLRRIVGAGGLKQISNEHYSVNVGLC